MEVAPESTSVPSMFKGSKPGAVIWMEYSEYGRGSPGLRLYSSGGEGNVIVSVCPEELV